MTVGTSPQVVKLQAALLPTGPEKPQRTRGTLAEVRVQPLDQRRFRVEPGILLSSFVRNQAAFGVADGRLVEGDVPGATATPTVFLQARDWDHPVFLTVGGGVEKDLAPKVGFFGVSATAGELGGMELRLGVGIAFTKVTTGLKGVEVGDELPEDIESLVDLDGVLTRSFQPSLGVSLGLTISTGGSPSAGSEGGGL